MSTPSANRNVAQACLRSWNRIRGRSAASRWRRKKRKVCEGSRTRPVRVTKMRPCSFHPSPSRSLANSCSSASARPSRYPASGGREALPLLYSGGVYGSPWLRGYANHDWCYGSFRSVMAMRRNLAHGLNTSKAPIWTPLATLALLQHRIESAGRDHRCIRTNGPLLLGNSSAIPSSHRTTGAAHRQSRYPSNSMRCCTTLSPRVRQKGRSRARPPPQAPRPLPRSRGSPFSQQERHEAADVHGPPRELMESAQIVLASR